MGDLRNSDGSWKKMVIAKSNNKWISTIQSESTDPLAETMDTNNLSIGTSVYDFKNIKKEQEDVNNESNSEVVEPEVMMEELDALIVPARRQRRRSSGPKNETPNERATRLSKMSAYAAKRLANETPEQRALRLKRMSEYAARRLSQETAEQRAQRLARMSAYAAKRLASESPEQRQLRLTRMSAYAAQRHAKKKVKPSPGSSCDFN